MVAEEHERVPLRHDPASPICAGAPLRETSASTV